MNPVIQQSRLVLVHTQGAAELGSKAGMNLEQCLSFEILTVPVLSDLQFFFHSEIPLGQLNPRGSPRAPFCVLAPSSGCLYSE